MTTTNERLEIERIGPWLTTCSGKKFFPLDPREEDVCIEDIAHGLAHSFRFAGQAVRGYTVAQHSIEVSQRVPQADALWGLLHDAGEAYLCDVPRPYKAWLFMAAPTRNGCQLPSLETVEQRIMRVVITKFGLSWPMPASVRIADNRELVREGRDLWGEVPVELLDLPPVEPYPESIEWCRLPVDIEKLFMSRFRNCLVNR